MTKTKKIIFIFIYSLVILVLPFFCFYGWGLIFVMPPILLWSIPLSIFVLIRFYKKPETRKWLFRMILIYVLGLLLLSDAGDGSSFMGIETFLSHFISHPDLNLRLIPESIASWFGWPAILLILVFPILNIVFLVKTKSQMVLKNNQEQI